MFRIAAVICAAALLSACGGTSTQPGPPAQSGPSTRSGPLPHLAGKPLSAVVRLSDQNRNVGIGPAFRSQSPGVDSLDEASETSRGHVSVRSGEWRDPGGRDGSHSARSIVGYLKSYLTEARREQGSPDADLIFVDFGAQKTLRTYGASPAERELVRAALSEINTALPWQNRILIGGELTERTPVEEIPDGEIHLYFTNGKAGWPESYEDPHDENRRVLGIGAAHLDRENVVVLSGFAFIDRTASELSDFTKKNLIAHEILHAYGIGGHSDPTLYPNSVMAPSVENFEYIRPFYLTIDGEGVLAETMLEKGARLSALTANDLGGWTENSFHLLGHLYLDDGANGWIQFGSGYRNGLAKPWVYGPVPTRLLAANPDFSGSDSAAWNGALLGFSDNGQTVAGDARIRIYFRTRTGTADFNRLEYWQAKTHPGEPGSGTRWRDGDLGYTIRVTAHGALKEGFVSTFAPGDDPGIVTGAFVGAAHEGAAGVLEHPNLSAAFAGKR